MLFNFMEKNNKDELEYWMPLWKSNDPIELLSVEKTIIDKIRLLSGVKNNPNRAIDTVLDCSNNKILRIKIFIGVEDKINRYEYYFFPFVMMNKDNINKKINNKINENVIFVDSYNCTIFNEINLIRKMRNIFKNAKMLKIKKQ